MTEDKRASLRIERQFVLRVTVDDGNPWSRWSLVMTHDLSVGGALFTIDQDVTEGQPLYFRLNFPDREIDCRGKVVRLIPGFKKPLTQLAVSFQWANAVDHDYVKEYTEQLKNSR